MTLAGLTREFLEFEEENGLFDAVVRGRRPWDRIRGYVFAGILSRRQVPSSPEGTSVPPFRWKRYTRHSRQLLAGVSRAIGRRLHPATQCDVAIANFDRWNLIDGQRVNMNCYPLVKALSPDHAVLVLDPYDTRADAGRHYPKSVVLVSGFDLVDRLRSLTVAFSPDEGRWVQQIEERIGERFGVSVDVAQVMRKHYAMHLVKCSRYRRLLETHRPRVVLAADHDCSLAEAAHDAGIPMIEMQHSMISSLNVPYNYSDQARRRSLPTNPDYVFTFGEYWNDKFNMPSRKIAVGYPFFDMKFREVGNAAAGSDGARTRNLIVISGYQAKQALVEVTLALSSLLPEITIFYKLKFSDYEGWRERYPEELWKRQNVRVIDSDAVPLYEYFRMCAWALGVNSGGLYEAMAFGAAPFVLKAGSYEESHCLYEDGCAFLVEDARQIATLMASGSRPPRMLDRESLFKSHAVENTLRELEAIIGNSRCQEETLAPSSLRVGACYGSKR